MFLYGVWRAWLFMKAGPSPTARPAPYLQGSVFISQLSPKPRCKFIHAQPTIPSRARAAVVLNNSARSDSSWMGERHTLPKVEAKPGARSARRDWSNSRRSRQEDVEKQSWMCCLTAGPKATEITNHRPKLWGALINLASFEGGCLR